MKELNTAVGVVYLLNRLNVHGGYVIVAIN